jgi:N-acetylglutamate synthase-like GNAT family acetyltransferase
MEKKDSQSIGIKLDYVIPGYRDFKTGKYVFNKLFSETGIKKIFAYSNNKMHINYLKKMGFEKSTSSEGEYILTNI